MLAKCFANYYYMGLEHRYIKKVFVKQRNSITKIDLQDKNRILRSMPTALQGKVFE